MPDQTETRAVRRSQADRSASTRFRVLQAAISVLKEQGYAGATMKTIAARAGVSLGALQHQFPTKAKLMAAVLRHFAAKRTKAYRAAVRGRTTRAERLDGLLDAIWRIVVCESDFTATVEIQMALRNDPDLEAEARPILQRSDRLGLKWQTRMLGLESEASFAPSRQLSNLIMHGMAVEVARGTAAEDLTRAYALWRKYAHDLIVAQATT